MIKTVGLDFVVMSGTLLMILNFVSGHLSGIEIEEKLWNSWTDNIRLEQSYNLLQRANRKALVVSRFFAEYHLLAMRDTLYFSNKVNDEINKIISIFKTNPDT